MKGGGITRGTGSKTAVGPSSGSTETGQKLIIFVVKGGTLKVVVISRVEAPERVMTTVVTFVSVPPTSVSYTVVTVDV